MFLQYILINILSRYRPKSWYVYRMLSLFKQYDIVLTYNAKCNTKSVLPGDTYHDMLDTLNQIAYVVQTEKDHGVIQITHKQTNLQAWLGDLSVKDVSIGLLAVYDKTMKHYYNMDDTPTKTYQQAAVVSATKQLHYFCEAVMRARKYR